MVYDKVSAFAVGVFEITEAKKAGGCRFSVSAGSWSLRGGHPAAQHLELHKGLS